MIDLDKRVDTLENLGADPQVEFVVPATALYECYASGLDQMLPAVE